MKIVVVDLDGTLADASHREHLARAKMWDEFHAGLSEDKPREGVAWLLRLLHRDPEVCVVACTGRPERYRLATYKWLAANDIHGIDDIVMRPNDDYRSDAELKPAILRDWIAAFIPEGAHVMMILDDRDKVVEAWRNAGYECWQVQPGGY